MGGAATIVVALVVAGFGMFGIGWRVRGRIADAEAKALGFESELVVQREANAEQVATNDALRDEVTDARAEAKFWQGVARDAGASPALVWNSLRPDSDSDGGGADATAADADATR